jgi:hypothetical protein
VTTDDPSQFAFNGTLEKIVGDFSGDLIEDYDAKLRSNDGAPVGGRRPDLILALA